MQVEVVDFIVSLQQRLIKLMKNSEGEIRVAVMDSVSV